MHTSRSWGKTRFVLSDSLKASQRARKSRARKKKKLGRLFVIFPSGCGGWVGGWVGGGSPYHQLMKTLWNSVPPLEDWLDHHHHRTADKL